MEEFLSSIVKKIVDNPEEVSIKEVQGDRTIIYELSVKKEDIGKVIGKQGKIINSLRAIINAAAAKNGSKAWIELIEE